MGTRRAATRRNRDAQAAPLSVFAKGRHGRLHSCSRACYLCPDVNLGGTGSPAPALSRHLSDHRVLIRGWHISRARSGMRAIGGRLCASIRLLKDIVLTRTSSSTSSRCGYVRVRGGGGNHSRMRLSSKGETNETTRTADQNYRGHRDYCRSNILMAVARGFGPAPKRERQAAR